MKISYCIISIVIASLLVTGCATIPVQQVMTEEPPTNLPTPAVSDTPTPETTATATSTPAGMWINLNPPTGARGTTVHVEGYLPGGLPEDQLKQQNYLTHADICWDGCTDGLAEEGLEVNWSQNEPGRFSLMFVVPSIPWLANDGVHKLEPSDYPISLRYLDPNEVNCTDPSTGGKVCTPPIEISASFYLTEGYTGPECQDSSSCGWLKTNPTQGAPGDIIQVQGWAPLLSIIGQPFGYSLVLETIPNAVSFMDIYSFGGQVQQSMDGSFSGSFQVPQSISGNSLLNPGSYSLALEAGGLEQANPGEKISTPILIAPAQFEITAAPAWTAQQRSSPLWIQLSSTIMDQMLVVDPNNSDQMAYCITGSIMASQDGGHSWASIPTDGIKDVALPGDMVIDTSQSMCTSVALDATHPDSYYAVFSTVSKQWGAPPMYYLGFYTTVQGKTWQLAPVTQLLTQSTMETGSFGGFFTVGNAVETLYYNTTSDDPANQPTLEVKQTTDGGLTWTAASLACPYSGPCLRWGAAPSEITGMGADLPQGVKASFDQGQNWVFTGQSAELRMIGPGELIALSETEALLISAGASYPLLYTADAGKTWQALALPPLPGVNSGWGIGYSGLQMLPDGSLVALNQDRGVWWLLSPSAQDWCSTGIAAPGNSPTLLVSSGGRIWWFDSASAKAESTPASSFACH
jgi:hypothetical protein